MKQAGRASLLTIASIVAVLLILCLLAFSRESVSSIGARFMQALQAGNVDKLTKMSYLGNQSEDEMRKQWDFAVNHAGKYYRLGYRIVGSREEDKNTATVSMMVLRNVGDPSSYEEHFELPLVRVDNDWKVDVRAISRDLYPALPR